VSNIIRSAVGKVMWVGRATVFLVGLAVIVALVLGAATAAFGANGDFFKVGRSNFASAVSVLDKSGAGPALRLLVDSGAPMAVNSSTKVANLNADKLDGEDSSTIGKERWAVVDENGSLVRSRGVVQVEKLNVGLYRVIFTSGDMNQCAYSATPAFPRFIAPGAPRVEASGDVASAVLVATVSTNGTLADIPFHLIVTC
jgi:hypothetical protein